MTRTVLGVDLGGASSDTTGFVVLRGDARPRVEQAAILPRGDGPAEAEQNLLALVDDWGPDVVAVDAPLTLPPCMTCPSFCGGPGPACELVAARNIWEADGNPVSQRLTELHLRKALAGIKAPMHTMQMGILTARAVAFARRVATRTLVPDAHLPAQLLEVYPRATLHRLGEADAGLRPQAKGEPDEVYAERVIAGFGRLVNGVGKYELSLSAAGHHVLDALAAAYTGWLAPDGLEPPPEHFNVAAGWIWYPRAAPAPSARKHSRSG